MTYGAYYELKVWYFMNGDESGEMHTGYFLNYADYQQWLNVYGDGIEVFKIDDSGHYIDVLND